MHLGGFLDGLCLSIDCLGCAVGRKMVKQGQVWTNVWSLPGCLCPRYLTSLRGHVSAVYQIAWSADSRLLVSGSSDSTLKVWDAKTKKLAIDLPGHADEVRAWWSRGVWEAGMSPPPSRGDCGFHHSRCTRWIGARTDRGWRVEGRTSVCGCE